MNRIRWQNHVALSDDLHRGAPCIKGTRIPVRTLIGSLADGMTPEEILKEYPQLSQNDLLGALAYAADVLSQGALKPDALCGPDPASCASPRSDPPVSAELHVPVTDPVHFIEEVYRWKN